MHRIAFAALSLCIALFVSMPVKADEAPPGQTDQTNQAGETTERKVDIQYSEVRARISPAVEFALPTGLVTISFSQLFNNLGLYFYLDYGTISSDINSEIKFDYNLGKFVPYVRFFLQADFENLVAPAISGSGIGFVPTHKYIYRSRGLEPGLGYRVLPKFSIEPSFLVDDMFKGSLTEGTVLDEGVDLVPRVSFVYDSVTAPDPEDSLYFKGLYYRSLFQARFRDSFEDAVSMENQNLMLLHLNIKRKWYFRERMSIDYPLAIWDRERANYYELGGFDTIRGYEDKSIYSYSFFLLTTDAEHEFLKDSELQLKKKNVLRIHQYRLKLLFDSLLTQDRIGIEGGVDYLASLGTGFAFVLSGKRNTHFRIELYGAQALTKPFSPIIYFRTSLFNLEKRL
jgi:hypothetical protein